MDAKSGMPLKDDEIDKSPLKADSLCLQWIPILQLHLLNPREAANYKYPCLVSLSWKADAQTCSVWIWSVLKKAEAVVGEKAMSPGLQLTLAFLQIFFCFLLFVLVSRDVLGYTSFSQENEAISTDKLHRNTSNRVNVLWDLQG
jgi:hypothetical protein